MEQIRTIIIDDEQDSRAVIKNFLSVHFDLEIMVVAEADSLASGLEVLSKVPFDLLFLDIQLKGNTGFDILEALKTIDFDIIFITTYDQYALKAIKHHAFDYLLKPLDRTEFKNTMSEYLKKRTETHSLKIQNAIRSIIQKVHRSQVKLPTLSGFTLVDMDDIVRLESTGNYTLLYKKDGSKQMTSKILKEYEALLPSDQFCRIHHSHMVNLYEITEYIKGRGGQVILRDGTQLNVSQNKKINLLKNWK